MTEKSAEQLFEVFKSSDGLRRQRILTELQEMGYHVDGESEFGTSEVDYELQEVDNA